jgi:acyl carrier protein
MNPEELEALIFAYLRDKLGVDDPELTRDSELVSSGLVDSGNLVRLATHLERIADITIPDRDIDVDRFDSVATIVDYVRGKLRG